MEIIITGRHFEVSDNLKDLAARKVKKLVKLVPYVQQIDVIFSQQKFRHRAEILVTADHFSLGALGEHEDVQASLDDALAKMENRLRRHKEKFLGKKHKKLDIEIPE
jgi:putative sigma-54 modulation protein